MPAPANLVHQTSNSTGAGNFTLSAVNGKQSFATAFGTGASPDVFDYFISNQAAAEWERGTGHMSDATTLVRDTIRESSSGGSAVDFSSGTKDVTCDVPAATQYEPRAAESDVASSATADIGAAATEKVRITGTTTITSFGSAAAGTYREGRFAAALTLTHNATSLILPGGASITTAANDRFGAYALGSGNWLVLWYARASGEAVWPPSLFKNLSADATGQNVNTAQPWFPSAGAVTLKANTAYRFEGYLRLSRSAGTTSHTTGISFGGTAAIGSLFARAFCKTGDTAGNAADNAALLDSAASTVVKAASTSSSEQTGIFVTGTLRTGAAGTLIPRFQYSAAPGGAPTVKTNSFFELTEIGSDTIVSTGTWS